MRRNKDFLRNIKKLTALVLAAAAIVTAYNIPIDKTRTITGFMQDPKKNYNAKNQVKVGTVKITAFKNRLTTEAELDKFRKNMGKKDFRETKLGDIEDEAFFYAEEYLPRDDIHIQMYYLKHVKTYKKDKMQFHAAPCNSFTQMVDTRWNKVSKASGYEIRIKQSYNGNWTDWTYRRTTANRVKIYGLDGARELTRMYNFFKSNHDQKYKYVDDGISVALSTGCTYKIQVRAYRTINGKYYYGKWSDIKTAGKIKRTPYITIKRTGNVVSAEYSMNINCGQFNYDYRIFESKEITNPFATKPTGFEVQTADDEDFKVNATTVKQPTTKTSITINDLPFGKFVRVRTYNDSGSRKIVGWWSEATKIK